jgi:hypothetical protein
VLRRASGALDRPARLNNVIDKGGWPPPPQDYPKILVQLAIAIGVFQVSAKKSMFLSNKIYATINHNIFYLINIFYQEIYACNLQVKRQHIP